MFKKVFSLVLIGIMAVSVCACSSNKGTIGASKTSGTSVKSKNLTQPSEHIYWYVTDNGTVLHLSATKPTDENYVEGNDDWENIFFISFYNESDNDNDFHNRYNDILKMGFETKLKNANEAKEYVKEMKEKGYSKSYFDNIKKVVIDNLISPSNCAGLFYNVQNIESIENISNINTEFVKSFTGMFAGCKELTEIDLSCFNTINAVSYLEMFAGCENLNEIDISGFSFDNIKSTDIKTNNLGIGTGVSAMFSGCSKLKTIYSNKDLIIKDKVDYDNIFNGCTSLIGGNGTPFNYNKADTSMAVVDSVYQSGYFTYDPSRYRWDGGCYYINGVKQINKWITDNFDMYYVDKNGKPLINKWKDGRYLGNDGKMLRNTKTPDGKFVNYQGDVVDTASDFASIDTNDVKGNAWFRTDNGIWYYFEGDRTTYKRGWFIDPQDEQTYYLDPSTGIMLTGWQEIDGNKYYFNERPSVIPNWYYVPENDSWASYGRKIKSLGSMFKNEETPDGHQVDANGRMIK